MFKKIKRILCCATFMTICGVGLSCMHTSAEEGTTAVEATQEEAGGEEATTTEAPTTAATTQATSSEGATSEETTETTTSEYATEMYDEKNALVSVSLLYIDELGSEIIIKKGYGFFVGDKNSDIFLITCHHMVVLSGEEKQNIANRYGVEIDKISTKIRITLKNDVTIEAALENSSESMDFAIVRPATDLSGATTLRVCDDVNINENGAKIYSYVLPSLATNTDASVTEKVKVDGEIQDWADINSAHYYKYNISQNPTLGTPLLNEQGEVIGINTKTMNMDSSYLAALQINEVTEIMRMLGLVYNPEIIIDTTYRDELLVEYEELEQEKYTPETWAVVEEKYAIIQQYTEMIAVGDVNYHTQDELNTACNEFRAAIDGLAVKEKSASEVTKIAIIIGIALGVIILTLIIILIVNRVKYKKKLEAEANSQKSAMEVLKMSGRVTPGSIYNNTNNMPANKSLNGMAGYGGGDDLGSETTILSANGLAWKSIDDTMEMRQAQNPPKLIRVKTGESVIINSNNFVLGKAPEMVDYCVRYNSGISRKHACIVKQSDGYYIQDLNATNGTFVNDMRVVGDRYVKLEHGCVIKLADEAFEFEE